MATEDIYPDGATFALTSLTGAYTDVDEDPLSPDANYLVATGNNTNVEVHASMSTPTGNPTVGAALQSISAWVRQFDTGQTGTPDARIELWENGTLVRAGIDTAVGTSGQLLVLSWNANEIATADGSLVEVKVIGTKSGGSPSARNTVDVGAIEWACTYDSGVTVSTDLYTDADSFGAAQVNRTETATLLSDGESFGAAQVNVSVVASAFADADTFPEATVSTSLTVVGTLLVDGDSFGSAQVNQAVVATELVDADSFGAAQVNTTALGALFADADGFPEATVTTGQTVAAALFSDGDSFGATQVNRTETGALLTDGETFGAAQVNVSIVAGALSDADSFGAAQVNQTVLAPAFADSDAFPAATVTTGQNVSATLHVDADSFADPQVNLNAPGALLVDGDTFPEASVVTGQTVVGTLYIDPDSFGAGVVHAAVLGGVFTDPDAFGAAQVNRVETAALYADGDTFPEATVTTGTTAIGTLYNDADTFPATVVHLASPATLYIDPDTFPEAVIAGVGVVVSGDLFVHINRFGLAMVHLVVPASVLNTLDAFDPPNTHITVPGSALLDGDAFPLAQVVAGGVVKHVFSIAADTATGAVNENDLTAEYEASSIGVALHHITTTGDVLEIHTSGALSPTEQADLDTLVGNHQGAPGDVQDAAITLVMVLDEAVITDDVTWQDLGAVVLIPSEFGRAPNLRIWGRLQAKCDDGPSAELAQLRLVDDDGAVVTQLQTTPTNIPDSTDWVPVAIDGDVAPVADVLPHRIRLEGRLNGSTSASVRRSNVSLVEMR